MLISSFGFTASLRAQDKVKLVKTKVNAAITVGLPLGFMAMSDSELAQRYPSVRRPIAAFTEINRAADFSINTSATQWPDANIEMASMFFRTSLFNLYDRVDIINEGILEQYGKRYIFFEFEGRVEGNRMAIGQQSAIRKYVYIYYLVEPARTLVFTFNTEARQRQEWQGIAQQIMSSIRVK
ncbi:MAG TPA: hypothetical protein PKC24_07775 [Cyclobacteriaceae bacterium]|nr:hypothetical protein [Cyclobacteriaceae bacterium]